MSDQKTRERWVASWTGINVPESFINFILSGDYNDYYAETPEEAKYVVPLGKHGADSYIALPGEPPQPWLEEDPEEWPDLDQDRFFGIGYNGESDYFMLDLGPNHDDANPSVIYLPHDGSYSDDSGIHVANSFEEFLEILIPSEEY